MYKVFYKSSEIIFQNTLPTNEQSDLIHVILYPEPGQIIQALNGCFMQQNQIEKLFIICDNPEQKFLQIVKSFYQIHAAGGVVINNYNEILLIKRAGVWDLPKGKIDFYESKQEAAIREVREETGVESISIIKELIPSYHIYPIENEWVFKTTHWYFMLASKSILKPQLEEKITEARWINIEQIQKYTSLMYPSLLPVLANAGVLNVSNNVK